MFWQLPERLQHSNGVGLVGSQSVRFSHGQKHFVVHALHGTRRLGPAGSEPVDADAVEQSAIANSGELVLRWATTGELVTVALPPQGRGRCDGQEGNFTHTGCATRSRSSCSARRRAGARRIRPAWPQQCDHHGALLRSVVPCAARALGRHRARSSPAGPRPAGDHTEESRLASGQHLLRSVQVVRAIQSVALLGDESGFADHSA